MSYIHISPLLSLPDPTSAYFCWYIRCLPPPPNHRSLASLSLSLKILNKRRPSDGTVMTLSILATDEEKLKILDSTSASSASCQCHRSLNRTPLFYTTFLSLSCNIHLSLFSTRSDLLSHYSFSFLHSLFLWTVDSQALKILQLLRKSLSVLYYQWKWNSGHQEFSVTALREYYW